MTNFTRWAAAFSLLFFACDDGGGDDTDTQDARVGGECRTDERRCSGDNVEVCNAGQWIALSACPAGQLCELGLCKDAPCEPQCDGIECGDDGCGGASCGVCADSVCMDGQCVASECGDGTCDPDESCEDCRADCRCPAGQDCVDAMCVEQPCEADCAGKACGPDGCGGACGVCEDDLRCVDGACEPVAAECGDDACDEGESCQDCPADCGACCGDGACVADHGEDCATCLADCGCPEGERCDAESRMCAPACMADCDGKVCGGDGCGDSCGECAGEELCDLAGQCVDPPRDCGNDACDVGEDCQTCPADCGQCCGNGACAGDENCATCPADCRCADGLLCDRDARMCVEMCARQCDNRRCGPDGCGGVCGACEDGELCDLEAGRCQAECEADCDGKVCGSDGCMGRCGECAEGEQCNDVGQCDAECVPACDGLQCGPDGCDGECGPCADGAECDAGMCVEICVPACLDRACGDDGCEGVCGVCADGEQCTADGECVPQNIGCDCAANEVCVDGQCRRQAQICGADNPNGLCPNGQDCIAGNCVDNGAACSNQNPAGVCAAGQVCRNGACGEFDGAALCDDLNPCTLDFFDAVRNACINAPQGADCSDGNGCTVNACDDAVCTAEAIPGCVEPPVIGPYVSPTNDGELVLTGTKPGGSAIEINDLEAVPESPDEAWDVNLNLVPGENIYRIRSRDRDNASEIIEVRVIYDITPPVTRATPDGGVYLNGLTVTVAADEPATVYYTTDGGTPDQWSESFQSARTFRIFDDTVLKFRARDAAGNWEEAVQSAAFEITGHGNGWRDAADLPEGLIHAGSAWLNGQTIYVAGGSDGLAAQAGALKFDAANNEWSDLPAMPAARAQLALARFSAFAYAFGGEDDGLPLNLVNRLDSRDPQAWEARRAMPSTRFGLQAVATNAEIFVFGGKTNGGVVLDTVEVYNPANDTWRNDVAQMPRPRYAFAAVLVGTRVYLIGGEDEEGRPIAEVDVYEIGANQWAQVAELPTPRSFLSAGYNENIGVPSGGSTGIVVSGGRLLGGAATAVVEEFVIELGEWRQRTPMRRPRHSAAGAHGQFLDGDTAEIRVWTFGGTVGVDEPQVTASGAYFTRHQDYLRQLAPMPEGRFMHAAASLGDRIYLVGGRHFQETQQGWAFDPETETYREIAELPSPQNGLAAVVFDGRVWAIGGANAFGNAVPTVRAYDPVRDEWTDQRPMLNARRDAYAAVVGDRIYVVGGENNGAVQAVEIYDPATDRWANGPLLPEARSGVAGVMNDGVLALVGGRNADGTVRDNVLSLVGDNWVAQALGVPVVDGRAVIIGDIRATVIGGRRGAAPSNGIWPWRLADRRLFDDVEADTVTTAALDFSAMVEHNGEIYVFGGNASPEIGPEGSAAVQKLRGTCFNGVVDGYEDPADRPELIDSGGGCLGYEVRPIALGANIGFGHHGSCNSWNQCGNAAGCAAAACQHFGHGPPVSFQQGTCGVGGVRCEVFRRIPNDIDSNFNGCSLPLAVNVVCEPR